MEKLDFKYLDKMMGGNGILNESTYKKFNNIQDVFKITLENGDTGVGLKINGETYGMTKDQALLLWHNIRVTIDSLKETHWAKPLGK
jgi:hypothetical protein